MSMTKAILIILATAGAVVIGLSTVGRFALFELILPLREIDYEVVLDEIPQLAAAEDARALEIALVTDIHFSHRQGMRGAIHGKSATIDRAKQFIEEMNHEVQPDFIVQLGDYVDGCSLAGECRVELPLSQMLSRIELAKQHTKARTRIPWWDVMGNHEYSIAERAKNIDRVYQAINRDWRGEEDSYYYRDVHGYRFIVLNTAVRLEERTPGFKHFVPEAEVAWLEEVLANNTKPVFVFMHVPISPGDGRSYDQALNQDKVSEILAKDENFVVGFFGHSHHTEEWNGLRKQVDFAGNEFYFVPCIHVWMGDTEQRPWLLVNIEPETNRVRISAGSGVERSPIREFTQFALQGAGLFSGWTKNEAAIQLAAAQCFLGTSGCGPRIQRYPGNLSTPPSVAAAPADAAE